MNKREAERLTRQNDTLRSLGFTQEEAEQLRRISRALHRWHELECGTSDGHIERDEVTNKVRFFNARARYLDPHDPRAWHVIPDRETGARKRLAKILAATNERNVKWLDERGLDHKHPLSAYVQTDPRGAALYILRPGDVPEGADVSAYYNRGICVY